MKIRPQYPALAFSLACAVALASCDWGYKPCAKNADCPAHRVCSLEPRVVESFNGRGACVQPPEETFPNWYDAGCIPEGSWDGSVTDLGCKLPVPPKPKVTLTLEPTTVPTRLTKLSAGHSQLTATVKTSTDCASTLTATFNAALVSLTIGTVDGKGGSYTIDALDAGTGTISWSCGPNFDHTPLEAKFTIVAPSKHEQKSSIEWTPPEDITWVDAYLLGAGGGGGRGGTTSGGGGGAGGFMRKLRFPVTAKTYQLMIGEGGKGGFQSIEATNGGTTSIMEIQSGKFVAEVKGGSPGHAGTSTGSTLGDGRPGVVGGGYGGRFCPPTSPDGTSSKDADCLNTTCDMREMDAGVPLGANRNDAGFTSELGITATPVCTVENDSAVYSGGGGGGESIAPYAFGGLAGSSTTAPYSPPDGESGKPNTGAGGGGGAIPTRSPAGNGGDGGSGLIILIY